MSNNSMNKNDFDDLFNFIPPDTVDNKINSVHVSEIAKFSPPEQSVLDEYNEDLKNDVTTETISLSSNSSDKLKFSAIVGSAGTGKTHSIRERIRQTPIRQRPLKLAATTGIAAVNLGDGITTINSLFKYYNLASMESAFIKGRITSKFVELSRHYSGLAIDEISMMSAQALDMLVQALEQAADYSSFKSPFELIIIADFLQLPPIGEPLRDSYGKPILKNNKPILAKAQYAFEADCWKEKFESNIVRLTKFYRQTEGDKFLEALNQLRKGDGISGSMMLKESGVRFVPMINNDFEGTTIMGTNQQVDNFNAARLLKVKNTLVRSQSVIKGIALSEWKEIPLELRLKVGSYVMILANDIPMFDYANGDCGEIVDYTNDRDGEGEKFHIKLARNDKVVKICKVKRFNSLDRKPDASDVNADKAYYDSDAGKWCLGEISYHPLRLAYATTCNKSQGLTLDKVQIDPSHYYFGTEGKGYVAVSRARKGSDLIIVGGMESFAKKIKIDERVKGWI